MGGSLVRVHIDVYMDPVKAAESIGQALDNGIGSMKTSFDYISEKVDEIANSPVIQESVDLINAAIQDSSTNLNNNVGEVSDTIGKTVHESMLIGANTMTDSVYNSVNNTADGIVEGFTLTSEGMKKAFQETALKADELISFLSKTFRSLTAQNTNEALFTVLSIIFILVPALYLMLILIKVEKKDWRKAFIRSSLFGLVICFVVGFLQYFRYVFERKFTINNICVCFYIAFYVAFFVLYVLYYCICQLVQFVSKLKKKKKKRRTEFTYGEYKIIKNEDEFEKVAEETN